MRNIRLPYDLNIALVESQGKEWDEDLKLCSHNQTKYTGPDLAAQLRQAHWEIEALYTLIDQAEAAYTIDI